VNRLLYHRHVRFDYSFSTDVGTGRGTEVSTIEEDVGRVNGELRSVRRDYQRLHELFEGRCYIAVVVVSILVVNAWISL
jgi:hypothetical protein